VICPIPIAASVSPASAPKLLDRVRWHLRVKHYSIRTEQAYIDWTRRFILFHGKRHRAEMGEPEIAAFLTHLAVDSNVVASTQNQAFSAHTSAINLAYPSAARLTNELVSPNRDRRKNVRL